MLRHHLKFHLPGSLRKYLTSGRWSRTFAFLLTILATTLAVLLVFNLGLGDQQVDKPLNHTYSIEDSEFRHAISRLLGPGLVEGNQIDTLINGEEIFPAMLAAIRSAQKTITLETYIFYPGKTARQFADALIERAQHGVQVYVLLDWVGGQVRDDVAERMEDSGVQLRWYHAPRLTSLPIMNNRTHRKILVVDGKTGFIGGVDIGDKWRGDAEKPLHWRDSHFRITGPVVGQLQAAFMDNWLQTTGELLTGPQYFPDLEVEGRLPAQVFISSSGGGAESMQLMYLMSIAAAQKSIHLSSAYFIPDEVSTQQLINAAKRGVKVQIIVPGDEIDWAVVRRASRNTWGPLLEAGVEIYEYQPSRYHVKLLVVDGVWTSVGSSNFDPRSFAINDESNLNVYSAAFAQKQIEIFNRDLRQSRRITLQEWRERSLWNKFLDEASTLLSPQL
ncbi:MAG TPA: phospholipase D-like domain-containing protein [Methylophilaceae bacterium]|nr:phospholipase D-like domain-containing protein [Methylophilaceae bacterium]